MFKNKNKNKNKNKEKKYDTVTMNKHVKRN